MNKSDVELRLPAERAYVAVLRTATVGLAARLDFTLEEIEDARIAVGEAATLVLEAASPGADLTAAFWLEPGRLRASVSVSAELATPPDHDSFAWTVLSTVAEAHSETTAESLTISFVTTSLLGTHPPA